MGLSPLAGQGTEAFFGAKRPEERASLRPVNGYLAKRLALLVDRGVAVRTALGKTLLTAA